MSIQSTEFVWRYPEERSDAGTNGGRMTAQENVSGVQNNLWPNVPESERTAGSTKYRKAFIHITNDDDITLVRGRVFVESQTPGEDSITLSPATQTDTQASIAGTEQQYGAGMLNADVTAGATSIEVMTEGVGLDYFKDGMLIRITDKATVLSSGNEEYVTVSGAPTYSGDAATITLVTGLTNSYTVAGGTKVASVIEAGDIAATYSAFVVTTGGTGAYDDTANPVLVDHVSGIYQAWTLTFTDATTFNIVGDTAGSVGTGSTSSGATPNNGDYTKPYFTLDAAGFSGTFQAGDTITFTTTPAAVPIWYKRVIPAGAASLTGDRVIVAIDGESA